MNAERTPRPVRTFGQMFGVPIVLALLTAGGLASALIGEALGWKVLAWIALSAPLAVAAWKIARSVSGRRPVG